MVLLIYVSKSFIFFFFFFEYVAFHFKKSYNQLLYFVGAV
jgi:hypothetical protein